VEAVGRLIEGTLMRRLRWLLLGLYLALLILVLSWPFVFPPSGNGISAYLGAVGFLVLSQLLFIFLPGRPEYLAPIEARRLLVPVLIAALMAAALTCGLLLSLAELVDKSEAGNWCASVGVSLIVWIPVVFTSWRRTTAFSRRKLVPLLLVALLLSILTAGVVLGLVKLLLTGPDPLQAILISIVPYWAIWAVFFYVHTRRLERFAAMRRLVRWVLAGSLLQLLATVPSHFIVSRRPGCFVGLMTFSGLMAGLYVLTWSFGPGIALLFWAEIRQRTRGHCPACGYDLHGLSQPRCPECGRPFTFHEVRATPEELEYAGR
jgi:hypothetical protein